MCSRGYFVEANWRLLQLTGKGRRPSWIERKIFQAKFKQLQISYNSKPQYQHMLTWLLSAASVKLASLVVSIDIADNDMMPSLLARLRLLDRQRCRKEEEVAAVSGCLLGRTAGVCRRVLRRFFRPVDSCSSFFTSCWNWVVRCWMSDCMRRI